MKEDAMPNKRLINSDNRAPKTHGTSNNPTEPQRRHKSGGNMGAGRSGAKSFGSERPETRDNYGSRRPEDADEFGLPEKK